MDIKKFLTIECPLKTMNRSSRPEVFCKKVVLRNLTKSTGKRTCARVPYLKLQALSLRLYLKRDSGTGIFL